MLEIRNLSVAYGKDVAALKNVNLEIPRGTVCAIIGPSGCGKSTLLKAIAGLKSGEGDVLYEGRILSPKEHKIGFMPQNYGLLPWKTVRDNILLGCRIKKSVNRQPRLEKLLTALGIKGLEERYPQEISGGQQQRVSLARVFLMQPDILLMDEPFSALDAITREDMQEVFLSLWRGEAVTTMLVTHYVEEALRLGQKIALMAEGRLVEFMDNPLFGVSDISGEGRTLRKKIKELGRNCSISGG